MLSIRPQRIASLRGLPRVKFDVPWKEHGSARGSILQHCMCHACVDFLRETYEEELEGLKQGAVDRALVQIRGAWLDRYYSLPESSLIIWQTFLAKERERTWLIHRPSGGVGVSDPESGGLKLQRAAAMMRLSEHPMFVKWWLIGRKGKL